MNVRELPSREKPPRQCWHQVPTMATQSNPSVPRKAQKGRKGTSSMAVERRWHLWASEELAQAPDAVPGRSHGKGNWEPQQGVGGQLFSSLGKVAGMELLPSQGWWPGRFPAWEWWQGWIQDGGTWQ